MSSTNIARGYFLRIGVFPCLTWRIYSDFCSLVILWMPLFLADFLPRYTAASSFIISLYHKRLLSVKSSSALRFLISSPASLLRISSYPIFTEIDFLISSFIISVRTNCVFSFVLRKVLYFFSALVGASGIERGMRGSQGEPG